MFTVNCERRLRAIVSPLAGPAIRERGHILVIKQRRAERYDLIRIRGSLVMERQATLSASFFFSILPMPAANASTTGTRPGSVTSEAAAPAGRQRLVKPDKA
jgi:hypothetical protein